MCLSVRVAVYNITFFIAKIVAQQGHGKLCKAQPRESIYLYILVYYTCHDFNYVRLCYLLYLDIISIRQTDRQTKD